MVTNAIKMPSARQPFTSTDERGNEIIERAWFLFLQSVWERQGGAVAPSTPDVEGSLFEDAGSSETNSMLFALQQDIAQAPAATVAALLDQQDALQAQIAEQASLIAELTKQVQALGLSPVL